MGRECKTLIAITAVILLVVLFWVLPGPADAATKTAATGTVNWNTADTWTPSGVPGSSDDVVIPSGSTTDYNISGSSTVLSLTVEAGGKLTFATQTGGNTLVVTGNVTDNGSIAMKNQTGGARVHTLTVGGDLINNGEFITTDPAGGTAQDDHLDVILNGAGAQTLGGTVETVFRDLTLSGTGIVTLGNNISLNHVTNPSDYAGYTLTVNSGAALYMGTYVVSGTGVFTLNSGGTVGIGSSAGITSSGSSGNVQVSGTRTFNAGAKYVYNASGAQATGSGLPTAAITGGVSIESGATVTSTGAIIVNTPAALRVNGTLVPGAATQVFSGTGTLTGTGTVQVTRTASTADFLSQYTQSTKTLTNLTVEYAVLAGSQVVSSTTYGNLKLDNTSGTDTAGGNVTVNGALITAAGGTFDLTSAYTLGGTLATITNNGTIKTSVPTATSAVPLPSGKTWSGTGTVEYAGATAQTALIGTYNNLTFSGAGAKTVTSGTVTVGGNWSVTGGAADLSANNSNAAVTGNITGTGAITSGSGTISLAGNWSNSGTFTAGNGTVLLNGASQQTIANAMTGSSSFYDLTITNASGVDDPGDGVSFTPGVIFSAGAAATHDYTITTPSVRVQYNSGSTYTFNNINWNGGASGTRIFFRNSNLSSGTWLLNVSGAQTAVSYVNVGRSDASSGSTIDASNGTNHDGQNNVNWFFVAANPSFFHVF
ncbi:MAG: G8 domain-containing protein [Candidatus Saganbacteria bacterium]|nr:G8 domain-containing protein [Candidatus Saganbacteria bacterium]